VRQPIAWNNRRHLEIYFGSSGARLHPAIPSSRLHPDQMVSYRHDAPKIGVMFFDRTLPARCKQNLKDRFDTRYEITFYGPAGNDEAAADVWTGANSMNELIADGDPGFCLGPNSMKRQPSSLCYTSGTTGNPKRRALFPTGPTCFNSLVGTSPDGLANLRCDTVMPLCQCCNVNAVGRTLYGCVARPQKLVLPGPGLDGDSLAKPDRHPTRDCGLAWPRFDGAILAGAGEIRL